MPQFRVVDTGLLTGRENIALDHALLEARVAGEIGDTIRFISFKPCALVGRPDLLVLDEPTVGLDPVLRADLWDRFTELARGGTTLLVSSHVMDEADHCADLLLMRDGRILAHTTPTRLRKDTGCQSLEEAFLSIIRRGTAAEAAPTR